MRFQRTCKFVNLLYPQSIGRFGVTSDAADTAGFHSAIWLTSFGGAYLTGSPQTIANNISVYKLQESDDSSTWSDIPECTFGNAACVDVNGNALALSGPSDAGDNDVVYRFDLNLLKRKRYLRVSVTKTGVGAHVSSNLILGDPSNLGEITNTKLFNPTSIGGTKTSRYMVIPQSEIPT